MNAILMPPDSRYLDKHLRALEVSYGQSAALGQVERLLREHLAPGRHPHLAAANLALIGGLADAVGLAMPTVVNASEVAATGDRAVRTRVLLQAVGASSVLVGDGGALKVHDFRTMNVVVHRIPYLQRHPTYPQIHERRGGGFMPGLSIIDCFLNVDPMTCRAVIEAVDVEVPTPWQPSLPLKVSR